MPNRIVNNKITAQQFYGLSSPLALDLIAVFSLLEEDIIKLTNKAVKEGWSEDKLIQEISDLI